jgi:hypothetical protein
MMVSSCFAKRGVDGSSMSLILSVKRLGGLLSAMKMEISFKMHERLFFLG